ncbi:tumor necrosis factor receptor superfamily member 14-like [Colossoma macropomum]|uniref:tumor necrosis factor receptor superfamily member 14-like n=1 Tax=Colossoma macropomum TaxID=42526 RepID=UPI00186474C3|nr:tumor necrosis factor receptor superfamily member 14-like [Colossoma macropomum]
MICGAEITFLIAAILSLNFELCFCSCARAEYEIDGECCPMCAPGNRVYRHCTADISTTCVSCHDSTFIDAPNGLRDCFSCTVCDPGQGLRVKTPCTRSSDTVCEPLDEHYCTDQHRGSCILAEKHTNCSTGQYIKHKGTAFKDTECAECADGTFSDGSFQTCQTHSKCEDLGLTEIKAGTLSSDAECGNKSPAGLIPGIIVSIIIIVAVAMAVTVIMLRCGSLTCRKNKQKTTKKSDNHIYLLCITRTHKDDLK